MHLENGMQVYITQTSKVSDNNQALFGYPSSL